MITELKCLNLIIWMLQKKHKEMSTDKEQSIEVPENNNENNPIPNSNEIMANYTKTELQGTEYVY